MIWFYFCLMFSGDAAVSPPQYLPRLDLQVRDQYAVWEQRVALAPEKLDWYSYDASATGITGTQGSNFVAFNNFRTSAFLTEIIALVHSENPVSATYALTALQTRDRPTFDRLSKLFLADKRTFTERSGCIVSSGYRLVEVIRELQNPDSRRLFAMADHHSYATFLAYQQQSTHEKAFKAAPKDVQACTSLWQTPPLAVDYETVRRLAHQGNTQALVTLAAYRRDQDLALLRRVVLEKNDLTTAARILSAFPHAYFNDLPSRLADQVLNHQASAVERLLVIEAIAAFPDKVAEPLWMRFATIDTQGPNRLLAEAAFLLMTRTPQSTKRFANTAYAYNRSFNLLNESLFRHAAATQPDRALLMAEHYLPTRDYDGSIRLWAQSRGSDGRFRVAELIDEIEDPILFAHLTDWLIADGRPHWVEPLLQRFSKRDDHRITFAILHLALRLDPTKTRRFVAQWLADNEATQQAKATLVQRFLAVDDPGR